MTRKEYEQLKSQMLEIIRNDDLSDDEQREQLRAIKDANPGLRELNIEHFLYTIVPLPRIPKPEELTDELIEEIAAEVKEQKQLRLRLEEEFWAQRENPRTGTSRGSKLTDFLRAAAEGMRNNLERDKE